ncbi:hypothetical protein [Sphingobium cloacae]|uniref:hypothetical protein n=1 Tax=Sphingobium cloacae TaxID=120107 RepID=UPI00082E2329|nr:hypothetical protein [Sphingobium cloacae]
MPPVLGRFLITIAFDREAPPPVAHREAAPARDPQGKLCSRFLSGNGADVKAGFLIREGLPPPFGSADFNP